MRILALALALVLALLAVPAAQAQETGGSFGGGSFDDEPSGGGGGGGSYGGGESSSSAGSSSSDWSSSSSGSGVTVTHTRPTTSSDADGMVIFVAAVVLFFVVVVPILIVRDTRKRYAQQRADFEALSGPVAPRAPGLGGRMDVAAVTLAIDWRARPFVQATLSRLAQSGDTKSKSGLARMLAETVRTLRAVKPAWLYSGALNAAPMQKGDAQMAFTATVSDARARFKRELVRAVDGTKVEQDAGPLRAKPTEGEGIVVVTVIVAARVEIPDVQSARDAADIDRVLSSVEGLGGQLVAMEVVWSPAAEDDRMSSLELEALYPDLFKLDERSLVGRVFCDHCNGPYPKELGSCPHCGAPSTTA